MQSELARPNCFMHLIRLFFMGRQDRMDLSAMRWWNYQRLAYNLRLIGCLFRERKRGSELSALPRWWSR